MNIQPSIWKIEEAIDYIETTYQEEFLTSVPLDSLKEALKELTQLQAELVKVPDNLQSIAEYELAQFSLLYFREINRLSKSGGVSEEDLREGTHFIKAVLSLTAKTSPCFTRTAKAIYDNLLHF